MPWEAINQQQNRIDEMGSALSIAIECTVRTLEPIYRKPVFECKHNVIFAFFMVEGAFSNDKWDDIIKKHDNEKHIMDHINEL